MPGLTDGNKKLPLVEKADICPFLVHYHFVLHV